MGIIFVIASAGLRVLRPHLPDPVPTALVTGWTMFPASVEYVLGVLGAALLAFALLHVGIDRRAGLARIPALLSAARTMSQYSLTMYLLHHALHLWPLWIWGSMAGEEPTQFWRNAMPEWAAVSLAGVCFVGCYLLFRGMSRREWPSVESAMRWVCDERE